jgi:hypothetical protein
MSSLLVDVGLELAQAADFIKLEAERLPNRLPTMGRAERGRPSAGVFVDDPGIVDH